MPPSPPPSPARGEGVMGLFPIQHKKDMSPQSIKRKKITTRSTDQKTTRSFKNLAITKPFPTEQTEEALRENEKRLQAFMDASPIGISWADMEGNIKYNNRKFRQLFGYTVDDIPTIAEWRRLAYPDPAYRDTVPSLVAMLTEAQKQGKEIRPIEVIITCKDGSTRCVEQMGAFASNRILAIYNDLTEHKLAEESLRKSEEKYRTILEEMEEGYFETDLAGNLTFINDAGCRNLGYPREELIGKSNRQYASAENAKKVFQAFNKIYRTGEPCRVFDYEITKKDGTKAINELSVSLMRDSDGKPIGFRGISHHITERKQMEEALRQSGERYRTILEDMSEGYFETDLVGNLTFINDAGCRNLGYPREELIGKDNRQYADEENRKKTFQAFTRVYRTGQPCRILDYELTRKDGAKVIIELSVSLMKNLEGKPIGFRGISHHVTEQRKMEEALRQSEERYRTIIENMQEVYYEIDLAGNWIFLNEAFYKHLGYTKEEMIGKKSRQYQDETTARVLYQAYTRLYETGEPIRTIEAVWISKDGSKRTYEMSASLITDPEGKPVGFRGVSRDITERKQMEESLRESENKFRSLVENSIVGVYLIQEGIFKYVNARLAEIHGYEIEEMVGKMGPKQATLPEDLSIVEGNIFKRMKGEEESIHYEFRIVTKKQEIRNVEVFGSRTMYQGRPSVIGTMLDITDRKKAEEALRQNEERYRTIIENIQDGYFEVDLAGNFTFVNDAECVIFGYSKGELVGMNNRQYTDKKNAKKLFQAFNKLYRTGEPVKGLDLEVIRKDGTKAFDELSVSLIRDSEGKPVGFRGISRDVTERKRAEEALRQSEEKYRNILESIEDGYYEEDLAGNFVFFNEAMCRIYGYPKEELLGLNYKKYTSEETAKRLFQIFNEMYRTGNPCKEYSYELIRKDGVKRYIEATASLKRDPSGKPIGFRGVVRDVTERVQAEEALRSSEEKYRTILETMWDGYFEVDLAGNFTFINDAQCRMSGSTRERLIGRNNRQYTTKEEAKKLYQIFNRVYRTGEPVKSYQFEFFKRDGTKAYNEISVSLIRDAQGKPIGFRGVSRDITERKQAEEENLSLQEQLRQSQKMEAIGQLAGGVAHDFNNLLTVIKGYSQISLLDLKENDPLRGNIQEIEKATQRATDLTRQLLAFSRRQILNPIVLDLNVLLKDLEKMLRRLIGEDVELVALLSEDLGKVKVDRSQIEQVIFNLAVNARDAMPSGGKLTIETANVELDGEYAQAHVSVVPGRYVRLSVSDTGVGMTQEVKEKVFDPFFTTKEKGKGTGLGLSMVYGIVKQSNGNIWVYSEPNRGTTFRIYFPRTEEEADTLREREETDFFPRGSETVLLVEDDELVRDLANRLLKQQGYTVLEASNGQEALNVAKQHVGETIHLLLADIVMPQMGGKELADWLKISRPNVKILFTSGYADNAIVHHGVLDPGTHFLQKPFSLKTLSHKVREVLDG
jgi:two-component system cell cycle sensor histidine kinase/response regulator CckA